MFRLLFTTILSLCIQFLPASPRIVIQHVLNYEILLIHLDELHQTEFSRSSFSVDSATFWFDRIFLVVSKCSKCGYFFHMYMCNETDCICFLWFLHNTNKKATGKSNVFTCNGYNKRSKRSNNTLSVRMTMKIGSGVSPSVRTLLNVTFEWHFQLKV